jgi:integrase/recombinase XerC
MSDCNSLAFDPPEGWAPLVEDWLVSLSTNCSPGTLRVRRQSVVQFARASSCSEPSSVTTRDLERWLGGNRWKAETRYSHRSALRSFYGHLLARHVVKDDPTEGLRKIRRPPAHPRACPENAFRAALVLADDRTRLMVHLAGQYGLRRGEIARIHGRDLFADLEFYSLQVWGKGGRVRNVPLRVDDQETVDAILDVGDDWLFPGRIDGHLSPAHVGELVKAVLPPGWTTHTLRHRFASVTYAAKHDVFALQQALGHTSPSTTVRYVQLPSNAVRDLVQAAA